MKNSHFDFGSLKRSTMVDPDPAGIPVPRSVAAGQRQSRGRHGEMAPSRCEPCTEQLVEYMNPIYPIYTI